MTQVVENSVLVWEGFGATALARIKGADGANITQASLTGITCTVYDLSDGSTVVTPTVVVADSVFDTLQTGDARWEDAKGGDLTGFNFEFALPDTAFPVGGQEYRVTFAFDPVTGADFPLVYLATAKETDGD